MAAVISLMKVVIITLFRKVHKVLSLTFVAVILSDFLMHSTDIFHGRTSQKARVLKNW